MMVGQISTRIYFVYISYLILLLLNVATLTRTFKKTYFANTSLMESVIRLSPQIPVGNLR